MMAIFKLAKTLLGIRTSEEIVDHKNSASSLSKTPSSTSHAPTVHQLPQRQAPNKEFSPTTPQCLLSFLLLPGEVRNLIYSYAVFPNLRTVTIHHCPGNVFSLPIFHVSRQIRHEAVSYLCASKTIYLSGLNVANGFCATIGEHGICSLRHVIVRCPDAWHSSSEKAKIKKNVFLAHLKHAKSLQRFELIIGQYPLSQEDLHGLEFSHTSGAKFLIACGDIVNGPSQNENEVGIALKAGLGKPCSEMYSEQAVACLHSEHQQHEVTEQSGKDVFRLFQVAGVVGEVIDLKLPY